MQIAGGSKGMGELGNVEANSFKDNNSNYSPMNLFNNTLSRHQNGWLTNASHPLSTKPALLKFTFTNPVKIEKMLLFPRSPSLISNFLKDYKLYGTNNENDINIQDSILEKKSSTLNLLLEVENETKPERKYHFGTDPKNRENINGKIPNPILVAQDQIDDNNQFILHKLITNPGDYKYYILEITKVRADNEEAASLSEIVFYKGKYMQTEYNPNMQTERELVQIAGGSKGMSAINNVEASNTHNAKFGPDKLLIIKLIYQQAEEEDGITEIVIFHYQQIQHI